jgi:integrase/recombinase XerD
MNKLNVIKARNVFKEYLEANGNKANTIAGKIVYLKIFIDYMKKSGTEEDLREITRERLLGFLDYLEKLKTVHGRKPLGKRTKEMIFRIVKQLFAALYRLGLLLGDPTERIEYKATGAVNRRKVLKKEEMSRFLDKLAGRRLLRVRDRALFELLYATGLRAGEAARLNIEDVNFEERLLLVRKGKWEKDRVVPLNQVSLKFLRSYLKKRKAEKSDPLFLSSNGKNERMRGSTISLRFKKLLKRMGMYRKGLCVHSIRHSVSVHLLANGADIRCVQALLGHESIETTIGYTHELSENIRKIYRRYHPRDNDFMQKVDAAYITKWESFYESVKKEKERQAGKSGKSRTAVAKKSFDKKR